MLRVDDRYRFQALYDGGSGDFLAHTGPCSHPYCFDVCCVKFPGAGEVGSSMLDVVLPEIGDGTVVVGRGVVGVQGKGFVKILDGVLVVFEGKVYIAAAGVDEGVLWVEHEGTVKVLDGLLMLLKRGVCLSTAAICATDLCSLLMVTIGEF